MLFRSYIPLIAEFCTELAGKKSQPNFKKLLEEEVTADKNNSETDNNEAPLDDNEEQTEENEENE